MFDHENSGVVNGWIGGTNQDSPLWSRLPLQYCPDWFEPMLRALGAHVAKDSDALMWYHRNDRSHLGIDTDKILFYAEGNPLQYRTYYIEKD